MKTVDRQKMCMHCNGRIPVDADLCPYCATQQPEATTAAASAPLFAPPYEAAAETARSSEGFKDVTKERQMMGASSMGSTASESQEGSATSGFWAVLFLSIATNLITAGMLQFFFSEQGVLKFEWDCKYWFLYCLVSVPLFYFGIKQANKLK